MILEIFSLRVDYILESAIYGYMYFARHLCHIVSDKCD